MDANWIKYDEKADPKSWREYLTYSEGEGYQVLCYIHDRECHGWYEPGMFAHEVKYYMQLPELPKYEEK